MAEGHWRIQFPNWSEEKVFGEVFVDHGTLAIERQVSPTLYELVRAFAPGGWLSVERISEDSASENPLARGGLAQAEAAMDEVERARGDAPHRAVPLAERIRAQFAPFTEKARP
jgi:hypothetical protein